MLSDKEKADIGNRIRDYRIMNRLTQASFAETVGISVNFLSEIENGKRGFSIDTLCYICSAYNISANYILFGDENTNLIMEGIIECAKNLPDSKLDAVLEYLNALAKMRKCND